MFREVFPRQAINSKHQISIFAITHQPSVHHGPQVQLSTPIISQGKTDPGLPLKIQLEILILEILKEFQPVLRTLEKVQLFIRSQQEAQQVMQRVFRPTRQMNVHTFLVSEFL